MSRKPVLVQLNEDLIAELDQLSQQQGRSRSAVVRDAVERYVVNESDAAKDRRMIEAYRLIPDDGEFDAWAEVSAKEMLEEESW